MTTTTLEQIEARVAEVNQLLASFKAQQARLRFTVDIELGPGEQYAGVVLAENGAPVHHVILLHGDADGMPWTDAKAWAAKAGGELPTRQEQALLYANLKGQFQSAWYWSAEEYDGSCAWAQYFLGGDQGSDHKGNHCRARAVRRVIA